VRVEEPSMAQDRTTHRRAPAVVLALFVGLFLAGEAAGASAAEAPSAPIPATSATSDLVSSLGRTMAAADQGLAGQYEATVNALRQTRGLRPLTSAPKLSRLATKHSRKMAKQHRLVHSDLQRLLGGGIQFAGENVGTGSSLDQVHQAFLQSPAHAGNLLAGKWRETGIGVYKKGGRLWITQIFAA
jgi:uncharacterized protein YkwD